MLLNFKAPVHEIVGLILLGVGIGLFFGVLLEKMDNGFVTPKQIWIQACDRGHARLVQGSGGSFYVWEEDIKDEPKNPNN